MILLSLIVPIYNVSEYLPKCLDSLFCQGLSSEEYEIICVNDGSTDDSLDIIQKYAEDNKQMVVITQTNGSGKNGGSCYSQNGDAVTVLMWQS